MDCFELQAVSPIDLSSTFRKSIVETNRARLPQNAKMYWLPGAREVAEPFRPVPSRITLPANMAVSPGA